MVGRLRWHRPAEAVRPDGIVDIWSTSPLDNVTCLRGDAQLDEADIEQLISDAVNAAGEIGAAVSVVVIGNDGERVARRSMHGARPGAEDDAHSAALLSFEFGDPQEHILEHAMMNAVTHGDRVAAMSCVIDPLAAPLTRHGAIVGSIGVGGATPVRAGLVLRSVITAWERLGTGRAAE